MKIFISTLGCKVNQYESQAILETFYNAGYEKSLYANTADVIIINSCTVTAESNKKVIKILRKLRKENASAIIVLTGCAPQAFPEKMAKLTEADIILGNANKMEIFDKVSDFILSKTRIVDIRPFEKTNTIDKCKISNFDERTRAFVKIEDGCNRFCSYCIIPYARGRVRSRALNEIVAEVQALSQNGYKEIVLVGINLSAYGTDLGLTLCDAVEAVCAADGIERIRLGSLEPEYLDEFSIKRLAQQKKLCPHFHLSLQSGCDATLHRMNRHYTTAEYFNIVQNLRVNFENVAITTDVMVGFAGETDEEFEQSVNFVKKVGFAKIHVFAYSVRSGTRAASFESQVSPETKKKRSKIMLDIANDSMYNFLCTQVGRTEPVLFERRDSHGIFEGYTRNYTLVKIASNQNLQSKVILTHLNEIKSDVCDGYLI